MIHTRDLVLTNDYLVNEQVIRRRKLFDDKYKLSSVVVRNCNAACTLYGIVRGNVTKC